MKKKDTVVGRVEQYGYASERGSNTTERLWLWTAFLASALLTVGGIIFWAKQVAQVVGS